MRNAFIIIIIIYLLTYIQLLYQLHYRHPAVFRLSSCTSL